jgi:hypothetical protein
MGIGAQPSGEIRLDGDETLHADLRNLGLDVNDPRGEVDAGGLKF